jgi:phage gpG-like protein
MQRQAKELHRYANNVLPKQAKDMGLHFFKSRFRAQGWLDNSFKPWPKRKRVDKKRPGRAILMDRGKLRNSIRANVNGDTIIFGTDVPYAKVHNEGGTITIGARNQIIAHKRYRRGKHKGKVLFSKNNKDASFAKKVSIKTRTIKMPQRQFMGESAHLNKVINRKIESELKKIFK